MKHVDVQNLKKELDLLLNAIAEQKITNSYLNYGLIKNLKILSKAESIIIEAIPKKLTELEKECFEKGKIKFEELPKDQTEAIQKLNQNLINDYIFNLGYKEFSDKDKKEHTKLKKDFVTFLELEDDILLYELDFNKLDTIDLELKYWVILEKFMKQ